MHNPARIVRGGLVEDGQRCVDVALDRRAAASLMSVGGMVITLQLLIVSVWRWSAAEERVAERAEAMRDGVRDGQVLLEPLKRE